MKRATKRPRCANKEIDKMLKKAWQAGWPMAEGGTGHIKILPPNSTRIISVSKTPSDHRAAKNIRATLRRHGLDV